MNIFKNTHFLVKDKNDIEHEGSDGLRREGKVSLGDTLNLSHSGLPRRLREEAEVMRPLHFHEAFHPACYGRQHCLEAVPAGDLPCV